MQVSSCVFTGVSGNGLFLSNHVTDSAVVGNEFVYVGDSAVALLGASVLADGGSPTYPHARDGGLRQAELVHRHVAHGEPNYTGQRVLQLAARGYQQVCVCVCVCVLLLTLLGLRTILDCTRVSTGVLLGVCFVFVLVLPPRPQQHVFVNRRVVYVLYVVVLRSSSSAPPATHVLIQITDVAEIAGVADMPTRAPSAQVSCYFVAPAPPCTPSAHLCFLLIWHCRPCLHACVHAAMTDSGEVVSFRATSFSTPCARRGSEYASVWGSLQVDVVHGLSRSLSFLCRLQYLPSHTCSHGERTRVVVTTVKCRW